MEQMMRDFLAANPQPQLPPERYAIGVAMMVPFFILGIMWFAKTVAPVSPTVGKWIADRAVLAAIVLGVIVFVFITTG